MQRIERYGVIALVFLLVTILAVSLWGESKGDGWFSKLTGGSKNPENTAAADRLARRNANRAAQLSASGGEQVGADSTAAGTSPVAGAPLNTGAAASNIVAASATPGAQGPASALPTPGQINGAHAAPPFSATPSGTTQPGAAQPGAAQATPLVANGTQPAATPVTRGLNDKQPVNSNQPLSSVQSPPREYKVKSGDTLGGIAQHELGSSKRVADIQKLNNNIDPSKLMPGMTLTLPPADNKTAVAAATTAPVLGASSVAANGAKTIEPKTTSQAKVTLASSRKYTVRSGDTLSVIASRELGSSKRWTEIRDLNPGVDEKSLKVSAVLNLPSGAAVTPSANSLDKSERVASLDPTPAGRKSRVQ